MLWNEPSCRLPIFPLVIFCLFAAEWHWRRLQVPAVREQTKFISFSSSWFLRVAVSQSDHIVFSSLCKRSAQIHQLFAVRNELSAAEIICPACAVYGKERDVRGFMSVVRACVIYLSALVYVHAEYTHWRVGVHVGVSTHVFRCVPFVEAKVDLESLLPSYSLLFFQEAGF